MLLLVIALTLLCTLVLPSALFVAWLSTPRQPIRVIERNKNRGERIDVAARRTGMYLDLGVDVRTGQPFVLPAVTRFSHLLTVGPNGVGKSVAMKGQIAQDIARPEVAVLVFDTQRALRDDITALCAQHGRACVVFPEDGFNPLNGPGLPSERAALIADLLGQIDGPPTPASPAAYYLAQTQIFIRRALPLYERAYRQPMILRELYVLATNKQARAQLVTDAGVCPEAAAFSEAIGDWSHDDWKRNTMALRGVIDALLVGEREWLYNQRHAPTLYDSIEAKHVILVQEGGMPGTTDHTLGQLFVVAVQEWVRKRNLAVSDHPLVTYLDEVPNYTNEQTPSLMNQSRQKKLALHVGFQAFDQLKPHTNALTTGARTWIIFNGLLAQDCVYVADQIGKRLHLERGRSHNDLSVTGSTRQGLHDRYLVQPHEIHNLPENHVLVLTINGREVDGHRILRLPPFPSPLGAPRPPAPSCPTGAVPTIWEERSITLTVAAPAALPADHTVPPTLGDAGVVLDPDERSDLPTSSVATPGVAHPRAGGSVPKGTARATRTPAPGKAPMPFFSEEDDDAPT